MHWMCWVGDSAYSRQICFCVWEGVYSFQIFMAKIMLINLEFLCTYRPVAQLAEQRSPKPQVGGSIPSWSATL